LIAGVFALVLAVAMAGLAAPVTSVFVYQGFLRDGNAPANGVYEIHFRLYDAGTNGTMVAAEIVEPSLAVTNGVFAATLDFGQGVFAGDARWLELAAGKPGDTNGPTVLQPRQPITASPYATYALAAPVAPGSVGAAQLATGAVQTVNLGTAAVTADKIASQEVVRSLNGLTDQVTLDVGAGLSLNAVGGNTLRITSNMSFAGLSLSDSNAFYWPTVKAASEVTFYQAMYTANAITNYTYYFDAVNGVDTTGRGAIGLPYKTMSYWCAHLPSTYYTNNVINLVFENNVSSLSSRIVDYCYLSSTSTSGASVCI
jgi:hypothetical protein